VKNVVMKYNSLCSPGHYHLVKSGSKDNGSFTAMPLYFSNSFMIAGFSANMGNNLKN